MTGETPSRVAFFAACTSVVLSLMTSARLAVTTWSSANVSSANHVWLALGVFIPAAGMLITVARWTGPLWACVGAMFGFVVLGAWSVGGFYLPVAGTLLIAAILHQALTPVRPRWRALLLFPWLLAGASGLGVFGRALAWWQTYTIDYSWNNASGVGHVLEARVVSVAPIEVWASWLFAAVCAVLVSVYVRSGRQRV